MPTITAKKTHSQTSSNITSSRDSLNPTLPAIDIRPIYIQRGLTKKNMRDIYLMGLRLYEAQKFNEAFLCFHLMTLLDWGDKKAWLGSAACLEVLKEYPMAILCYMTTVLIDSNDPMPLLRCFHCYLQNHDQKNALALLENAIKVADKNPDLYSALKEEAIKLKELLLR